jgi:hypothetical protein
MFAKNKTHDALVADWKENAKEHDDENYWYLRSLKQKSGKRVDRQCRIHADLDQEVVRLLGLMCRVRRALDLRMPSRLPAFE